MFTSQSIRSALQRPTLPQYVCQACQTQSRQIRTRASRLQSRKTTTRQVLAPSASPSPPPERLRLAASQRPLQSGPAEPSDDPDYKPAQTSKGLQRIGSPEWIESRLDKKPAFKGFGAKRTGPITEVELDRVLRDITLALGQSGEMAVTDSTHGWIDTPIQSHTIKFRLAVELIKSTGIKIPDAILYSASRVKDLRDAVVRMQRPEKTSGQLAQYKALDTLANVEIHDRRQTMISKERRLGRWKLIKQELNNRGLPVTGRGNAVSNTMPVVRV